MASKGKSGNLGEYLVPSAKSSGGANPRKPTAAYFVRGGEQSNREVRLQSPITAFRRVDPDNAKLANFQQNFVVDYSEQKAEFPGGGFVRGLGRGNREKLRTTNKGGEPAMALPNIVVGGGEDDKGNY